VQWVGLTIDVYRAGLMVEMSRFTREMEVSGLTRGETDWLLCKWSMMTMLRFRPVWNGVDVVRWFEEARWRLGVWAESSSLERSLELGVEEKVAGGDLIVTLFLIGELCLAPDGLLCLFEVFSEDGRDLVLQRGGVGVVRAELGVLEAWSDAC